VAVTTTIASEGMVASVLWGGQTANTMCEEGSEEPPGGRDHVAAKSGNEWCLAAIMLKQRGKRRGWGPGHGGATWRRVGRGGGPSGLGREGNGHDQ
jgi:hypothetical protein